MRAASAAVLFGGAITLLAGCGGGGSNATNPPTRAYNVVSVQTKLPAGDPSGLLIGIADSGDFAYHSPTDGTRVGFSSNGHWIDSFSAEGVGGDGAVLGGKMSSSTLIYPAIAFPSSGIETVGAPPTTDGINGEASVLAEGHAGFFVGLQAPLAQNTYQTAAAWRDDSTAPGGFRAVTLSTLPGTTTAAALGANASEQIVGFSGGNTPDANGQPGTAVLWQPNGQVQSLGVLPGESRSAAAFINDSGTVAGVSGARIFEWTASGGMVELPLPAGTTGRVTLRGIDSAGDVLATIGSGSNNAVLWTSGAPHLLTDLVGGGWNIDSAYGINRSGQILAVGQLSRGVPTAIILTPK